ncbi:uncharacterized protein B0I36DRAFT_238874 [Microdochium trichocladiopsis]|uniref:DUF8213 domain-containing protein n=1 Tax=Microdochium trichocladiopsis TaxID=1682393 RepID=A0A9P9BRF2_9PEZI|nr:uncharacterized protein B0I36DRAFT_238874 [Microdochium trichocladiopsis]KAH7035848.1 hypothetical protein B0I36DRAFT_238874 [Microdochium trichocladiopsis]
MQILSILAALFATSAIGAVVPAALEKRAITCVAPGSTATARWTNAAGQACTFNGIVGSNYGKNAAGGDYSCNGRCGAGCSGVALGNFYTQDCFSHDICSYFENASGGASDKNCGAAFNAAADDTIGGFSCAKSNPSNAAVAPSTKPVCV